MHAVRHDDRKHHDSGFLKTTTWGALIALSLVLLVLGSTGHLSRFVEGPSALRADTGSSSPDSSVASEFAKPTNPAGTLISPSGPTGLHPFFASRENHSVSAPNVSATRTSSGLQALPSPVADKILQRSRHLNLFFLSGASRIVRRKSLLV